MNYYCINCLIYAIVWLCQINLVLNKIVMTNEKQKEEFCTACLAVPVALAGGGAIYGGTTKGSTKKYKKILIVIGILTILIAIWLKYKVCSSNTCNV